MKNPAIEVNNLSFSFGNGAVLNSVSFNVEEGEYLAIVGPNGAGKTTLLKNIMRILSGGSGYIRVAGTDIRNYGQRELARKISYVPQPDGRHYPFSAREFILMGKYPYLNPFSRIGPQDEYEAEQVLDSVHMRPFKDRGMDTLSSGERQKIMIAASLIQKAEIFLLDEPTTFLDPRHEEEINKILKKLNRERGITIISVTHNLNLASILSDNVLALKAGSVAYAGVTAGFMQNSVLSSVYEKEFELMPHPGRDIKIILPDITC